MHAGCHTGSWTMEAFGFIKHGISFDKIMRLRTLLLAESKGARFSEIFQGGFTEGANEACV